jgi:hypothetical protein
MPPRIADGFGFICRKALLELTGRHVGGIARYFDLRSASGLCTASRPLFSLRTRY